MKDKEYKYPYKSFSLLDYLPINLSLHGHQFWNLCVSNALSAMGCVNIEVGKYHSASSVRNLFSFVFSPKNKISEIKFAEEKVRSRFFVQPIWRE